MDLLDGKMPDPIVVYDECRPSVLTEVLSRAQPVQLLCVSDQFEAGPVVMPIHVGGVLFIGTALDRNVCRQSRNPLLVVSTEKDFGELGSRLKFDLPIHRFV